MKKQQQKYMKKIITLSLVFMMMLVVYPNVSARPEQNENVIGRGKITSITYDKNGYATSFEVYNKVTGFHQTFYIDEPNSGLTRILQNAMENHNDVEVRGHRGDHEAIFGYHFDSITVSGNQPSQPQQANLVP
jgi:hypothetical protein